MNGRDSFEMNTRPKRARSKAIIKKLRIPIILVAVLVFAVLLIGTGILDGDKHTDNAPIVLNETRLPTASKPTPEPIETELNDYKQWPTFSLGDEDSRITYIQSRLMSLGYMEADEPQAVYNQPLENAVKLFQRANNMTQTGETDSILLSILYSDSPTEYVMEFGNSGDDVLMLQERLNQLGYYDEKLNGYYGASTVEAIETFQDVNGIDPSGKVASDTFDLIFSYDAISKDGPRPIEFTDEPRETPTPEMTEGITDVPATPVITDDPTTVPAHTATPLPSTDVFVPFVADGYTNAAYVNLRSEPSTSSAKLGVLTYGTKVHITAKTSEWYRVQYNGITGYISLPYVTVEAAATPSAVPTAVPTATPTPKPTAQPTATPKPTATPAPTTEPFIDFVADGYTNAARVNLRSEPSTSSAKLGVLTYGTKVHITAKTSEWYRVQYNGITGYISLPYVTVEGPATPSAVPTAAPTATPTPKPTAQPTATPKPTATPAPTTEPFIDFVADGYTNVAYVNLRSEPSTSSAKLGVLPYGTGVHIVAKTSEWYRVQYNGATGYISVPYVTIGSLETPTPVPTATPKPSSEPTPTPKPTASPAPDPTPAPSGADVESFIAALQSHLGKTYVYGTSGPNTFDCSGLVYYSLKQIGVNIGRLSSAGYSVYEGWNRVNGISNLKRGDLMFFYNDAGTKITHVAVYIGNNQLIHASSSAGKVVISNISNWHKTHFAWGRRVF